MYERLKQLHDGLLAFFKKSKTFSYIYDRLIYNPINFNRIGLVSNFHLFFNLLSLLLLAAWIKNWAINWGVDYSLLSGMDSAIMIFPFFDSAVCLVFLPAFLILSRFWMAISFIVFFNSFIHLTALHYIFESEFLPHYIKQNIYVIKWVFIFICASGFIKYLYFFDKNK